MFNLTHKLVGNLMVSDILEVVVTTNWQMAVRKSVMGKEFGLKYKKCSRAARKIAGNLWHIVFLYLLILLKYVS